LGCDHTAAGARGFRDFPILSVAKENRNGSYRTPPHFYSIKLEALERNMKDSTHIPSDLKDSSSELSNARDVLRTVIQNLFDSQEALQQIEDRLHDPVVKRFLLAESLRRAEFRGELETLLHQEGVRDISETGTVAGKVHRMWAGIKASLGGSDYTLLSTAETIESGVCDAYYDALDNNLPLNVRQILRSQYAHVKLSHDYVEAARDHARQHSDAA
jgi:uncharacterized protein (TIGR02284 family)